MVLPLLVLALIWEHLGTKRWLKPHVIEARIGSWTWRNTRGMVIAGALTVAVGCLLFVSGGVFSGLLDVSTQSRIEGWIVATFSRSWDVWMLPVLLLAIALIVLARNLKSS